MLRMKWCCRGCGFSLEQVLTQENAAKFVEAFEAHLAGSPDCLRVGLWVETEVVEHGQAEKAVA